MGYKRSQLNTIRVQEAMRMLPVLGNGTNRTTTRDMLIGGYHIPRDTMVWIPLYSIFNSPHYWEHPERYWPVRVRCHKDLADRSSSARLCLTERM